MSAIRTVAFAIAALLAATQGASAEDRNAAIAKMMVDTKLIAVGDWDKPTSEFVEDNDSNSLEIVFLKAPNSEPSHVSDDGEAIFLNPNATDEEQQALTLKAFGIRYDKRNPAP